MEDLATSNCTVNTEEVILINGEEIKACPCGLGLDRWASVQCKQERNKYQALHLIAVKRENEFKQATVKNVTRKAAAIIKAA